MDLFLFLTSLFSLTSVHMSLGPESQKDNYRLVKDSPELFSTVSLPFLNRLMRYSNGGAFVDSPFHGTFPVNDSVLSVLQSQLLGAFPSLPESPEKLRLIRFVTDLGSSTPIGFTLINGQSTYCVLSLLFHFYSLDVR